MWRALRAELAYSKPYLLGSLGIAGAVTALVSVLFYFDPDPPSFVTAGVQGMFPMMAPLIVGFIVQANRTEERRARLLLAGPLTPLEIAGASVLLPVILLGIGALAAALVLGSSALITGKLEPRSLAIVGSVGGQMFLYVQMGLLAQEASAARRQRRHRASAAGWAMFAAAVLLLAVLFLTATSGILRWPHPNAGHLAIAVGVVGFTVALHRGRTDFTR